MGIRRIISLVFVLLVLWTSGISLLRENLEVSVRLFNDDYDRGIYAEHGKWAVNDQVPYREVFSEYPQVPTYLFALPYLFIPPSMNELVGYYFYSSIFSFAMLAFLFGTVAILYNMLTERKWLAFLMLLPASLYFTYNRFDILPAFLCLLSLLFLKQGKKVWAVIVLAVATLTKWYPILLLPVYLSYDSMAQRRINWSMILAFGLTCLLIVTPTLLTGGLFALLVPYRFHVGRGADVSSLVGMVLYLLELYRVTPPGGPWWFIIFSILQMVIAPFSLFDRVDSFDKVVHWCILVLAPFLLFSRIYSPQWLLWLMPLLILSARTRKDIALIFIYDISTYLAFPVTWDFFGHLSWQMKLMGVSNVLILITTIITAFFRAQIRLSFPPFSRRLAR
jgi:hypothetical protein